MNQLVPSLSFNPYQHMANLVSEVTPTASQRHACLDYFKAIKDFLTIPTGDVSESNKH